MKSILNKVSFDGKDPASRKWSEPSLKDFVGHTSDWNDLSASEKSAVKSHYLLTMGATKNPPDDFSQLKLPVVGTNGKLNKHALDNAAARVAEVKGLTASERARVKRRIESLQHNFGE